MRGVEMTAPPATGATAFAGGRLRREEAFDVVAQCFANGATGLGLFEDPYTVRSGNVTTKSVGLVSQSAMYTVGWAAWARWWPLYGRDDTVNSITPRSLLAHRRFQSGRTVLSVPNTV